MSERKLTFRENGWLRTNIKYAIIGIIVGLIVCLFTAIFSPNGMSIKKVMLNIFFSLFITLSITNIIAFVQCYFTPSGSSFWKFVMVFYVCNFIGMYVGIELSYLIVSLVFK